MLRAFRYFLLFEFIYRSTEAEKHRCVRLPIRTTCGTKVTALLKLVPGKNGTVFPIQPITVFSAPAKKSSKRPLHLLRCRSWGIAAGTVPCPRNGTVYTGRGIPPRAEKRDNGNTVFSSVNVRLLRSRAKPFKAINVLRTACVGGHSIRL